MARRLDEITRPNHEESRDARESVVAPRASWKEWMLTREDIGYGPAQQYEAGRAGYGSVARERRKGHRAEVDPAGGTDVGPYWQRLLRRERPDRWIQAEIEEALFFDTWIDANRITVEVRDGVATLIGTLHSYREAELALDDARRVPGVRQLRDRLDIEP